MIGVSTNFLNCHSNFAVSQLSANYQQFEMNWFELNSTPLSATSSKGTHRISKYDPDRVPSTILLQDWKNCKLPIFCHPQVANLSPLELRLQDYSLIRSGSQPKHAQLLVRQKVFNPDLLNRPTAPPGFSLTSNLSTFNNIKPNQAIKSGIGFFPKTQNQISDGVTNPFTGSTSSLVNPFLNQAQLGTSQLGNRQSQFSIPQFNTVLQASSIQTTLPFKPLQTQTHSPAFPSYNIPLPPPAQITPVQSVQAQAMVFNSLNQSKFISQPPFAKAQPIYSHVSPGITKPQAQLEQASQISFPQPIQLSSSAQPTHFQFNNTGNIFQNHPQHIATETASSTQPNSTAPHFTQTLLPAVFESNPLSQFAITNTWLSNSARKKQSTIERELDYLEWKGRKLKEIEQMNPFKWKEDEQIWRFDCLYRRPKPQVVVKTKVVGQKRTDFRQLFKFKVFMEDRAVKVDLLLGVEEQHQVKQMVLKQLLFLGQIQSLDYELQFQSAGQNCVYCSLFQAKLLIQPSLQQIIEKKGQLSWLKLSNQFGTVEWKGKIQLDSYDISSLVRLEQDVIEVYPTPAVKPARGSGLNQYCVVRFRGSVQFRQFLQQQGEARAKELLTQFISNSEYSCQLLEVQESGQYYEIGIHHF